MPYIAPLSVRRDRYARIRAMADDGKTLEEIGAVFGISRERVRQVLDKPPRKPGPPFSANKVALLREKLALWEKRRAARLEANKNTIVADERLAALRRQIEEVESHVEP